MGLPERVSARLARSGRVRNSADPLSWDQWQDYFGFGGLGSPFIQTTMGGLNREKVAASAVAAYKSSGPVFALVLARMQVFSQVRFQWTRFQGSQPGDLFGTPELSVLENPWPGGTTPDLLARMEMHDSLAGNAYVRRTRRDQLNVLRPDFVTIILGSQEDADHPADAADVEVAGYLYIPPGGRPQLFLPDEVAHFAPIPDPWFHFLGQSWITPVLRELQGDQAAVEHKFRYFENGATVNLAIKFDPAVSIDAVKAFRELLEEDHRGVANAFRTLYLGGGADPVPVGSTLKDMDYAVVQGRAESRLAAAAGVPPSWVGFSEGLQGSALNAGNFDSARRRFSDGPQPLDAKILTPGGWTTMGEIAPGDEVIGSDGKSHRVMGVFPQGEQDIYRVTFSDGAQTECTYDHLWQVASHYDRKLGTHRVLSLRALVEGDGQHGPGHAGTGGLCYRSGPRKWSVPLPDPVEFSDQGPLPVDPYLLGLLLGDGSFRGNRRGGGQHGNVTLAAAREDADEVADLIGPLLPGDVSFSRRDREGRWSEFYFLGPSGPYPGSLKTAIRDLGLWDVLGCDKAVPRSYMRASIPARIALLQGLVDSDGSIGASGQPNLIRFTSTSRRLSDNLAELVLSLGGMASVMPIVQRTEQSRPQWSVLVKRLPSWITPCRLARKVRVYEPPGRNAGRWRYMTTAEPIGRKQAQCILVDAADSLYVTDDYVLTHNTMVHLWGNASASLQPILSSPPGASLWYDAQVPFMREDAGDQAAIQLQQAETIGTLVKDGFTPESAVTAVLKNDFGLLSHSGLVSVQLLPPGEMIERGNGQPPRPPVEAPPAAAPPAALPASNGASSNGKAH